MKPNRLKMYTEITGIYFETHEKNTALCGNIRRFLMLQHVANIATTTTTTTNNNNNNNNNNNYNSTIVNGILTTVSLNYLWTIFVSVKFTQQTSLVDGLQKKKL
jgi:hypothetical protein